MIEYLLCVHAETVISRSGIDSNLQEVDSCPELLRIVVDRFAREELLTGVRDRLIAIVDSRMHDEWQRERLPALAVEDLLGANLRRTDVDLVDLRGAEYTPDQARYFERCGAILNESQ